MGLPAISRLDAIYIIEPYLKKNPMCLGLFEKETQQFKAPTYHCHPLWGYLQLVGSMQYL